MAGEVEKRVGDYVDSPCRRDGRLPAEGRAVAVALGRRAGAGEAAATCSRRRCATAAFASSCPIPARPARRTCSARVGDASTGPAASCFCGHFDVYPPSKAWSFDPWSAPIRDGQALRPGLDRHEGRHHRDGGGGDGACGARRAEGRRGRRARRCPTISKAAKARAARSTQGLTAEAGIVCEPTDLDICAAQRGILYMDITIKGVGAHTTYEEVGVNAIEPVDPDHPGAEVAGLRQAQPRRVRAGEDRQHRADQRRAAALPDPRGMRAHRRRAVLALDHGRGGARRSAGHHRRASPAGQKFTVSRRAAGELRQESAEPDGLDQASDPRPCRRGAQGVRRQAAGASPAIRRGRTRRC